MPIPADRLAPLEDALNRLAGESMLATAGRDDGLIPAYSLLGELVEYCTGEHELQNAVTAVHKRLDRLLETGKPYDEAAISDLRGLVEWMQGSFRGSDVSPRPETAGIATAPVIASPPRAPRPSEALPQDVLLVVDVAENRELLTEFRGETEEHLQSIEAALLALEQQAGDTEALNSIFRSFHTIKGNAGFLGLVPMHILAHEVESLLELVRAQQLGINTTLVTEILRGRDALKLLNQQVGAALDHGTTPVEIISVSHIIGAVRKIAEGGDEMAEPTRESAILSEKQILDEKPHGSRHSHHGSRGSTVRVNTEKLDALMDVVGELVIVQSQLNETARKFGGVAPTLPGNVALLSRITKELQHTAMSLRMIPIQPTFQKMERLARDLAKECGKNANFTTDGGETELDRTMVEEIADPLVHMVRNALDHGLESPEDRKAAGKPDVGSVSLKAYHQGGRVMIELRDDGRGLDPDKILAKARRKGLVQDGAHPSREEIFKLIFLPGFSTADKVTALSGRGVGMDVVKRNIERLRGEIEISSEVGKGSLFTIKLPLTMAIIDGLVVRVGDDRFILPSTSVQRALRPTKESIVRVQGCGEVLDHQGKLIPLHRLHKLYGIRARALEPWDGIVVIVESAGKVCALLVDEMVGKQEVVIKNLGGFLRSLSNVAGAAILGDGTVALIVDPSALMEAA